MSAELLYKLLKREKETGSIPRKFRAKILQKEHYLFIDEVMAANDETTARQMKCLLEDKWPGLSVSLNVVKRARKDLGWVATRPKYCQLVRDANKEKGLAWSQKMLRER